MGIRGAYALLWASILTVIALPLARAQPSTAASQPAGGAGDPALRAELLNLVAAGKLDEAIGRVQARLQQRPNDAGVRAEFVALHITLARERLAREQYEDCRTFLSAALAVAPTDADALRLRDALAKARERAGQAGRAADRLVRFEMFEAALDEITRAEKLRPELTASLRDAKLTAWLGAADDHYLARNFNEAFALYEKRLRLAPAPDDVRLRWGLSLALAFAEQPMTTAPLPAEVVTKLHDRTAEVVSDARLRAILNGLLLERAGQLVDAGREFAAALGRPFDLPTIEQRKASVAKLRTDAIGLVRDLYQQSPTRRRAGAWAVASDRPPKSQPAGVVTVIAADEQLGDRLADAVEYHWPGLAEWLGVAPPTDVTPRVEIHLHPTTDALVAATGAAPGTPTVAQTRQQGQRVIARTIHVTQTDPWLLSATLPRELTLALLDRVDPPLPPAVAEGLALAAECGARRLMYRRTLAADAPDVNQLLALTAADTGSAPSAELHGLAEFLLATLRTKSANPAAALREALSTGGDWRTRLGWKARPQMEAEWRLWHENQRTPPRMPIMIMNE